MVAVETKSSILKKDIQAALAELGKDHEVFACAEISSEALQRSVEKYGQLLPDKFYDYWHEKHAKLQKRVENIESDGNFLKSILESIQGYFKACLEAASVAGGQLRKIVEKHPGFSVNQVRVDVGWMSQTIKLMVLLKGSWPEAETPSKEAMEQFSSIEADFLNLEETFIHEYSLTSLDSTSQAQIRMEAHLMLMDFRLDADSLTRDYPIFVKC